jgi:hypothetical protein
MTAYEQMCFDNATVFSAVRGNLTTRTRQEFASFADAQNYAATFDDKKTMIYAITAQGNNAHICNA